MLTGEGAPTGVFPMGHVTPRADLAAAGENSPASVSTPAPGPGEGPAALGVGLAPGPPEDPAAQEADALAPGPVEDPAPLDVGLATGPVEDPAAQEADALAPQRPLPTLPRSVKCPNYPAAYNSLLGFRRRYLGFIAGAMLGYLGLMMVELVAAHAIGAGDRTRSLALVGVWIKAVPLILLCLQVLYWTLVVSGAALWTELGHHFAADPGITQDVCALVCVKTALTSVVLSWISHFADLLSIAVLIGVFGASASDEVVIVFLNTLFWQKIVAMIITALLAIPPVRNVALEPTSTNMRGWILGTSGFSVVLTTICYLVLTSKDAVGTAETSVFGIFVVPIIGMLALRVRSVIRSEMQQQPATAAAAAAVVVAADDAEGDGNT